MEGFSGGISDKEPACQSMQETQKTWVQSLDWEDPLVKETATHSSILAWWIPWRAKPGRLNTHTPLLRRQTVYVTCFQRLTLAWLLTSSIKFYSLGPFPVFKSMRRSFLLLWPSWEGWLQQTVQHQLHHLHPCAFHKGMGPMHDAYRVHQWCLQSAHRLFLGNSESKQN